MADRPGTAWAAPPAEVALPPGEVHVWRFAQDVPEERQRRLAELLSPEERQRRLAGADEDLVARFFSPREREMIRALPAALRPEAFFHCWTRKEAYIKAIGLGLSQPLRDFTVSVHPGEPAALLEVAGDPGAAARWRLHALHPGPGFVGALAAEAPEVRLRCWAWEG